METNIITKSQYLEKKYGLSISTFRGLDALPPELIELILEAYKNIDKDWEEVMY